MQVQETNLDEVKLLVPRVFADSRGFFLESYNQRTFGELGIHETFVQDNHSRSERGVLRGLHYQLVQPQGKLVQCLTGSVFDVAVDLRRSSPTFGRWLGVTLSAQTGRATTERNRLTSTRLRLTTFDITILLKTAEPCPLGLSKRKEN